MLYLYLIAYDNRQEGMRGLYQTDSLTSLLHYTISSIRQTLVRDLFFAVVCLSTRLDAQILKSNILKYVKPQLAGWYYQMTQKILSCISTFC